MGGGGVHENQKEERGGRRGEGRGRERGTSPFVRKGRYNRKSQNGKETKADQGMYTEVRIVVGWDRNGMCGFGKGAGCGRNYIRKQKLKKKAKTDAWGEGEIAGGGDLGKGRNGILNSWGCAMGGTGRELKEGGGEGDQTIEIQ